MTNESHEYHVVLEFHGDDVENFDPVIALEAKLEEKLLSRSRWARRGWWHFKYLHRHQGPEAMFRRGNEDHKRHGAKAS